MPRLPLRPALAPADVHRLALLFVPAALLLGAGRLLEVAAAKGRGPGSFGNAVQADGPLVVLLLGLVVAAGIAAYQRAPAWKATAAAGAALAVGAGGGAVLRWALPRWVTGGLDAAALGFLRADLVALLAVVALLALGLATVRQRAGRWALLALAHGAAVAVCVVAVADLAVLLTTGARGGYFALRDFLAHPVALLPVVASELTPLRTVLLASPVLVGLAPLLLVRRRVSRSQAVPARRVLSVCALPALVLVALPVPTGDLYPEGALPRMAAMVWDDVRSGWADPGPPVGDNPYDLRSARLVATDSTRALNVVVVVLESVRQDATTPYAPGLPTTPFLDSLARNGLLVEDMYTTTPYTNKALVGAFGGVPASPEAALVEALPGGIPSPGLAGLLSEHGYRSAFVTPATLAFERKDQILRNLGFEEAFGDGDFDTDGFQRLPYFGYEDRVVLDHTLAWVADRAERSEPFVLGVLTLTSHHPYEPPEGSARLGLAPGRPALNRYYDAVRYTDDVLRQLVTGLDDLGVLDEALLVVVADHGEAFGEHGQTTHGNVIWEEALRIPAVIYSPALVPAPGRVAGPRSLVDLLPTAADALNLAWEGPPPPGRSLFDDVPADRPLVHASKDARAGVALRQGSRKVVYEYGRRPTRLYDLARDPAERTDLAPDAPAGAVRRAERQLLAWTRTTQQAYVAAREQAGVDLSEAPPSGLFRPHSGRP